MQIKAIFLQKTFQIKGICHKILRQNEMFKDNLDLIFLKSFNLLSFRQFFHKQVKLLIVWYLQYHKDILNLFT